MTAAVDSLALLPAEMQAIIAGIQERPPPTQEMDWESVARLSAVHGVISLLHSAWRRMPDVVPHDLLERFGEVRQQAALRGMIGLQQRDDVVAVLQRNSIQSLVLKGAALAQAWYGDVSLRPFVDIDVLLPAHELHHAQQALTTAGYLALPVTEARNHLPPLYRPDLPCAVELHHSILPPQVHDFPSFEALHARSYTVRHDHIHVRTLAPEDTLLHLCLHLVYHMALDRGWQFRRVCDVARHIRTFPINWTVVHERAVACGAERETAAVLGLAFLLTDARAPTEHIDFGAAREMQHYFLPDPNQHTFVAAVIAAVIRADLRQAAEMVATAMVDWKGGGRLRLRDLRPQILLPNTARLIGDLADPGKSSHSRHLRLRESIRRFQRQQLFLKQLTAPGPAADRLEYDERRTDQ